MECDTDGGSCALISAAAVDTNADANANTDAIADAECSFSGGAIAGGRTPPIAIIQQSVAADARARQHVAGALIVDGSRRPY